MSWLSDYHHEISVIQSGKLQPVYFLYGNDFYLRDKAIQTIRHALADKYKSYDYSYFPASEIDASELQNLLFGTSLFQSVRCGVIDQIKGLLPLARKIMNSYLQQPIIENILIITADKIDNRNAFYNKIKAASTTLMINTPFENEIPVWIRQYTAKYERDIDVTAINELIRCVGADLSKLSNELDKVHIYLPDNKTISKEDVRLISGYSKTYSIEQLLDAIGDKDKGSAIAICKNLIENGVSEVYLITAMYQFIWKLVMLKDIRLINSANLEKILRIYRPNQLNQIKARATRYSMQQLKQAIKAIVSADRRLKTTSCDTMSNFMIALDGIMS